MRKIIIDTDCGLDDAMAIMLALAQVDIEILAMTCVSGNTDVDNVAINVTRVLNCFNAKIPIYKGAVEPLMGNYTFKGPVDFHGSDGFGDVPDLPVPPIQVEDEHAASALVRFVETYPGEVTIIALGPLTNLALAVRLQSSFAKHVKEIHIMGGNVEGLGNTTATAEANFWGDPEAAYIVLNKMECPITITPWETCLKLPVPWEQRTRLLDADSEQANLIRVIEHTVEEKSKEFPGYILCDQFAMVAMIFPSIVSKQQTNCWVSVELSGKCTRGQMVVCEQRMENKKMNRRIIHDFKMDLLYSKLFKALRHKS